MTPQETQITETLYFKSPDYFTNLARDLNAAKISIDIEMYIWGTDDLASEIFECLVNAVKRGVKVRVIVDGVGSLLWIRGHMKKEYLRGVQVQIFNPMRFPSSASIVARLNRRNHRKIVLIDNALLYTGSLNITKNAYIWRETGLCTSSAALELVRETFEYTWLITEKPILRFHYGLREHLYKLLMTSKRVRSNQFFRLRKRWRRELTERIDEAKQKVWFVTSYFVPPPTLLRSLSRAAKRGIDVRLILPHRSDVFFMRWVSEYYYLYLLDAGVKIYEYTPTILHAKNYIVDDWATVGSTNLNHRSFFSDLEMDIVLTLPESLKQVELQFLADIEKSIVIKDDSYGFFKGLITQFLLQFKRWL